MRKRALFLLIVMAVSSLLLITGCRPAVPTTLTQAPALTHPDDVRFKNCNACHLRDLKEATPFPHFGGRGYEFTNGECMVIGCHPPQTSP
jgi:hypothetical protein